MGRKPERKLPRSHDFTLPDCKLCANHSWLEVASVSAYGPGFTLCRSGYSCTILPRNLRERQATFHPQRKSRGNVRLDGESSLVTELDMPLFFDDKLCSLKRAPSLAVVYGVLWVQLVPHPTLIVLCCHTCTEREGF